MADKKASVQSAEKPKLKTALDRAKKRADAIAAQKAKAGKGAKGSKSNAVVKYFKDMRSELKKVVWPSRKKVLNNTIVVLVVMILVGLIVWVMDLGLSALISLILK